jgi:hypothetical protein
MIEKILRGIVSATYLAGIIGTGLGIQAIQEGKPGETLLYFSEGILILSGSLLVGSREIKPSDNSNYQDY